VESFFALDANGHWAHGSVELDNDDDDDDDIHMYVCVSHIWPVLPKDIFLFHIA